MPPAFSPVEVTAASFTQPRNCVFFACAAIPAALPLALAVPVTRMFFEHRAVRRKEQGSAAAGRLRRHLRDAVAVAIKCTRKRGLRAADAVEPADNRG